MGVVYTRHKYRSKNVCVNSVYRKLCEEAPENRGKMDKTPHFPFIHSTDNHKFLYLLSFASSKIVIY